jgi:hypothetical protein
MGKVTEEFVALLTKQVQDRGLVVWYDPEQAYGEVVGQLDLPEITVLPYQGSFFDLRYRLEPFLEFVDDAGHFHTSIATPPRVLVYVPLDRATTQHALIEAEAAGVVMEPGGSPWQRNTRLKVLAERVFKRLAPDRAGAIAAEVEAGRRSLAELDWLADQSGELGAVKLVFGTMAVADVVLTFLSTDAHDQAILSKHALPELASLCATELGLSVNPEQPIGQVRHQICRSLLLAELAFNVRAAGGDTAKLAALSIPEALRQPEQLLAVCQHWRNRLDLRQSYATWADTIQTEAHVLGLGLHAPALKEVETVTCVESLLLDWVETRIQDGDITPALEIATRRKTSFWSLYAGEYQLRWTLLELAAQLLLAADRITAELKTVRRDARAIIKAYTEGIAGTGNAPSLPWCVLDRQYRHLEHRYALLGLRPESQHAQLEQVITLVRRRYADVVGQCAESLTQALTLADFDVEGVLRQDDVFRQQVRSRTAAGKTAYVLVDALRYEMGQEFVEGLGEASVWHVSAAAAAAVDTSMAASLPRNGCSQLPSLPSANRLVSPAWILRPYCSTWQSPPSAHGSAL